MSEPRFILPSPAEMTPRQKEVAEKILSSPRAALRGPYVALIHHPDLADAIQQMGQQLRFHSTLAPALVELAILIVARHWTCQFEWFAHEDVARNKTDLPDSIIRQIQAGAIPDNMSGEQEIVHDFITRTVRFGEPSNTVYDAAVERFGRQGVLELTVLTGYYSMIAMVLNTTQIPLPEGTPRPLREQR